MGFDRELVHITMESGALNRVELCGIVAVYILAFVGCARSNPVASAFEVGRADLRSRSTYHMVAVVEAPRSLSSALDGTYEIDVEAPDRFRTVRMVGSQEVSRTITIGDDLYVSDDQGVSWQRASVSAADAFSVRHLFTLLDRVCTVEGSESHLRVEVASQTRGCNRPLLLIVELHDGVIRTIRTKLPTDFGSVIVRVHSTSIG